jgi:hypothetical protein
MSFKMVQAFASVALAERITLFRRFVIDLYPATRDSRKGQPERGA